MNGIYKPAILPKTVLLFLLASLGGLLFSGFLINFSLNQHFHDYLGKSEALREKQTLQAISDLYLSNGGSWPEIPARLHFRQGFNNLAYVTDLYERMVIIALPEAKFQNLQVPLKEVPVTINNRLVGYAFFLPHPLHRILSQQDFLFRKTINHSILLAVILTGFISILVAIIFARHLSKPITAMNQIAKDMAAGQLDSRMENLPQDELGELGRSLNQLAARLKETEALRKKMTADVAHELRTPLATIRSHLEGMIDEVILPSRENLDSLLEEANRLTSLINSLQEIINAEKALLQLNPVPLSLDSFLKEIIKKITPLCQEKGVLLELENGEDLVWETDREALTRILFNLLTNACKFTPKGKKVTVTTKSNEELLTIAVRDQGIGIAPAELPFIFERFYRTDSSRSRESGGFGLGLTIVKELTEALGGQITATSNLGQGSTFTLTLPRQVAGKLELEQ